MDRRLLFILGMALRPTINGLPWCDHLEDNTTLYKFIDVTFLCTLEPYEIKKRLGFAGEEDFFVRRP